MLVLLSACSAGPARRRSSHSAPGLASLRRTGRRGSALDGSALRGSALPCHLSDVSLVMLTLSVGTDNRTRVAAGKDNRSALLDAALAAYPAIQTIRAVNGHNHTEVIEALLASGLSFHNVSSGGRQWGMLACFLSHVRALLRQVETGAAWQLTMEDDLVPLPSFPSLVDHACGLYANASRRLNGSGVELLQLSPYTELRLTSLEGAKALLRRLQRVGLVKNVDQQFNTPAIMGVRLLRHTGRKLRREAEMAWTLARKTNRGDIARTEQITWAEMAMLRLLTNWDRARRMPSYGNPRGGEEDTDLCAKVKCRRRALQRFMRG